MSKNYKRGDRVIVNAPDQTYRGIVASGKGEMEIYYLIQPGDQLYDSPTTHLVSYSHLEWDTQYYREERLKYLLDGREEI